LRAHLRAAANWPKSIRTSSKSPRECRSITVTTQR